MPLYPPNPLPRCCADASSDNADTANAKASAHRRVIATSDFAVVQPPCRRHSEQNRAISTITPSLSAPQDSTLHTDLEQEIRRSGDWKRISSRRYRGEGSAKWDASD